MKKVSCSVLQSQALAASSYVSADDSRVEESDVDLDEVIGTTDFYEMRKRPCLLIVFVPGQRHVIPHNESCTLNCRKNDLTLSGCAERNYFLHFVRLVLLQQLCCTTDDHFA